MTIICRLVYRAGNICNHFFTRDFLQVRSTWKTNERETFAASVCWARKAASPPRGKEEDFFHGPRNWKHCQVGSSRNTTPLHFLSRPTENNGIKLEKFVFDVFEFSEKFVVWECHRWNLMHQLSWKLRLYIINYSNTSGGVGGIDLANMNKNLLWYAIYGNLLVWPLS